MQKWEYASVPLIPHAIKDILDNWGDDGWELVQIYSPTDKIRTVIVKPDCTQLASGTDVSQVVGTNGNIWFNMGSTPSGRNARKASAVP